MTLRRLKEKDANYMLEWMHDEEIINQFEQDFKKYNLEDCIKFIKNSNTNDNMHFAIANDNDEYLGTISLKNISYKNRNAEYAISMRKSAHGTGVAMEATKELLNKAFNELSLEKVYLNVLDKNCRAIRFYNKVGFKKEAVFEKHIRFDHTWLNLLWFRIFKDEFIL